MSVAKEAFIQLLKTFEYGFSFSFFCMDSIDVFLYGYVIPHVSECVWV